MAVCVLEFLHNQIQERPNDFVSELSANSAIALPSALWGAGIRCPRVHTALWTTLISQRQYVLMFWFSKQFISHGRPVHSTGTQSPTYCSLILL